MYFVHSMEFEITRKHNLRKLDLLPSPGEERETE
jgi:hypothetical protein